MATALLLVLALLILVALVGGGLVAVLAARKAPDGFEDQEGFHACRLVDRSLPSFLLPERTNWEWKAGTPVGVPSSDTAPRRRS